LFLSPGRHAGAQGDVAQICASAHARCHFTGLVGTHRGRSTRSLPHCNPRFPPFTLRPSHEFTPEIVTIPVPEKPLHKNEQLKSESHFLRGNILRDLADTTTGGITEESSQLTKFHGVYAQDDRTCATNAAEMARKKPSFHGSHRVPGGVCTPSQWLALDSLANEYANGTLKITPFRRFSFTGSSRNLGGDQRRESPRCSTHRCVRRRESQRDVQPNPEQSALHPRSIASQSAQTRISCLVPGRFPRIVGR